MFLRNELKIEIFKAVDCFDLFTATFWYRNLGGILQFIFLMWSQHCLVVNWSSWRRCQLLNLKRKELRLLTDRILDLRIMLTVIGGTGSLEQHHCIERALGTACYWTSVTLQLKWFLASAKKWNSSIISLRATKVNNVPPTLFISSKSLTYLDLSANDLDRTQVQVKLNVGPRHSTSTTIQASSELISSI